MSIKKYNKMAPVLQLSFLPAFDAKGNEVYVSIMFNMLRFPGAGIG
jgi:hypothetical protein